MLFRIQDRNRHSDGYAWEVQVAKKSVAPYTTKLLDTTITSRVKTHRLVVEQFKCKINIALNSAFMHHLATKLRDIAYMSNGVSRHL